MQIQMVLQDCSKWPEMQRCFITQLMKQEREEKHSKRKGSRISANSPGSHKFYPAHLMLGVFNEEQKWLRIGWRCRRACALKGQRSYSMEICSHSGRYMKKHCQFRRN